MKFLVIFPTILVCICAAPVVELNHPSPVNPDVLVAVKPEEKIILITDLKEISKFKRETEQPLYPTVLPKEPPALANKSSERSQNIYRKRDIPVPLVAKHHHPEESKKESNEKESYVDEKVQNSEKQLVADHITTPIAPLISKDTFLDLEKDKRDIAVPLVPKHSHPKEFSKEINDNESFGNNKEEAYSENNNKFKTKVNEQEHIYNVGKTLLSSAHNQESSNGKGVQIESKEVESENQHISKNHHVFQTQPTKSHIHISTIQKMDDNNKNFAMKELQNQEKNLLRDVQKSYVFSIHQERNHPEDVQNTKTKQTDLKELTESTNQQYGIQSIGDSHRELSQKESNINKNEVKKIVEEHSNIYDRKDLSDFTSSTTENFIIRHRPVPVAELFTRAHGN